MDGRSLTFLKAFAIVEDDARHFHERKSERCKIPTLLLLLLLLLSFASKVGTYYLLA